MTDDYKLHVFDLTQQQVKGKVPHLAEGKKDRKKITMCRFYPGNENKIITVSTDSIITWDLANGQLTSRLHS